jgi:flagellar protein FlgJ
MIEKMAANAPALTATQKQALTRLHQAATQLEGVFLNMLFSAMRSTVPTDSIYGKESNGEQMFQSMLDEEQANSVAQTGSFGIAKVLENQLRSSVLSDAKHEASAQIPGAIEP